MEAYKTDAVIQPGGKIILETLPFKEGKQVEVIILEKAIPADNRKFESLKGSVKRYDRPFDPVAEEDWEANK